MPGLIQSGRKRAAVAISDDEDEQSDYPSSASTASKRVRQTRNASESPVRTNLRANNVDTYLEDEFQPGSIIRVKLKNFVTYTAAEFHLGPSLNMVIGPNGTGKSTLVCAICLGLGWGSEHLGRAKDLGAFVKHGAAEAEIEIELAAGPGMTKNPVIQRTIRKEDNKSYFLLNGKRATQSAVTTMCKSLSIQIDNLCQFLPQDRVVEFAKMTDVDRLKETQRAAAPAHMVDWHYQLRVLRSDERDLETQQRNEAGHLEKLEKQQNATRGDVERWHQREGLLQKSRCLKKVKPIIEIRLRKNELNQAKEDLRAARRELDQINAEVEPVRKAQDEVEQYRDQIERTVKLRKNRVDTMKAQADKHVAKVDKEKEKISESADKVKGEVNSKKSRERDIARLKADISKLDHARQIQPVHYDASSFDTRKADFRAQLSALQNQLVEKEELSHELRSQVHDLQRRFQGVNRERTQLDTQVGLKSNLLMKASQDTAAAWEWFKKNKHTLSLKGEVAGPPILECSVTDAKYAQAVESQVRRGDLLAITCTNADDQQLLSNCFLSQHDKGGLALHDIHLRTSPKPLVYYKPPIAPNNLSALGFDGYILDYIQGPDLVLAMLCDNTRLHQIAFASKAINDEQHATATNSGIRKYVSGRDIFSITVRQEYNATSTSVTQLRKPQWFVEQPANSEDKQRLDELIKAISRDAMEVQDNNKICNQEMSDIKQQISVIKEERVGYMRTSYINR